MSIASLRSLLITQDYPPDLGGMARLYGELFDRMDGVEVSTVAAATACDERAATIHRMRFPFRRAHRPANILRWTRWARRFVIAQNVDLIHAGNVRPTGYIAALLRRRLGVPYTVFVHGKDLLKERRKGSRRWIVRAGTREILGNAAAIIANSSATAAIARSLLQSVGRADAADRVHVVHPGVDPARFVANERQSGCRWVGVRGPVLLSVARIIPRKGIDTVIEALPAIVAEHPETLYVIVGSGPDVPRLERLAEQCGVTEHVRFVGDVADAVLPAFYAGADLFLLPTREIAEASEIEGFGIAYVEASACGVPTIGADAGGVSDAVRDGVTGVLVPPNSPIDVARATLKLLADDALRVRLGANGRREVEQHLNWDRAAREVEAIARSVVRGSEPRRSALPRPAVVSP